MAVSQEALELLRDIARDRISVLVVGDQSVGKTTLVRMICERSAEQSSSGGGDGDKPHGFGATGSGLRAAGPTTGCAVSVALVNDVGSGKSHFIEFYDVSGSTKWADLRPMVYGAMGIHGVLLVHDLTNRRSFGPSHLVSQPSAPPPNQSSPPNQLSPNQPATAVHDREYAPGMDP